jgi:diaminopimelate epimerase
MKMTLNKNKDLGHMVGFTKMHGLGNDFVIVAKSEIAGIDPAALAKKISAHKLGIGCDQFIIYDYQPNVPYVTMDIYNPDGSKAKACGNASRCLGRLMFDQYQQKETKLDVMGRKIECSYISKDAIKVDMGQASFDEKWMPKPEKLWPVAAVYGIEPKEMICVDVGNPHLVIFSKLSSQDQETIGKYFQKSDLFPDGVNVNFADAEGDQIFLTVWERGTGITLACGSGACASFAAADKLDFVKNSAEVVFSLGKLNMTKSETGVNMTGPAEYVFTGEYYYVS